MVALSSRPRVNQRGHRSDARGKLTLSAEHYYVQTRCEFYYFYSELAYQVNELHCPISKLGLNTQSALDRSLLFC